jgi:hypothetical protein
MQEESDMAKFAPGQSGNPRGRPKGKGTSPATILRRSIEAFAPELIATLRKAAQDGDVTAAVALLDRALPKLRSAPAPVTIPLTGERDDVTERILLAVADGEIAAADGSELLTLVRQALGEEPPRFEPIDREKLDAIYAAAMARAEAQRLEFRHRNSPEFIAQFDGEQL